MKRSVLTMCIVLVFVFVASASFAAEKRVASSRSAKSFSSFDPSYEQIYVCTSQDVPCAVPVRFIDSTNAGENPVLYITFYAPADASYSTHYIVSDFAGTFAFYNFSGSRTFFAGFNSFQLPVSLPPGDYTFTSISVNDFDGTAAISDPYKFHVE